MDSKKPGPRKRKRTMSLTNGEELDSSGEKKHSSSSSTESDGNDSDLAVFEPFVTLNRPKGLVDGLTQFFTPSNKRKSRVSLSSLQADYLLVRASKQGKQTQSKSQQAASKLLKKCKRLQVNKGRKRLGKPPGSGQLKGLFDGLSHLFSAQGERKRNFADYSLQKRRRKRTEALADRNVSRNSNILSPPSSPPRCVLGGNRDFSGLRAFHGPSSLGMGLGRGRGNDMFDWRLQIGDTSVKLKGRGRGLSLRAEDAPVPDGRGRGRGAKGKMTFM